MDLKIIETGNGGDLVKKTKDLEVVNGFQNMPYLAMFGGNPGFSTPISRNPNAQSFDWWGNSLLMNNNKSIQFNSLTEQTLMEVALNSSGAAIIEQAIKDDLSFMDEFANVDVSATIVSDDKIAIGIVLNEPDNKQEKSFIYIWDATNIELSVVPENEIQFEQFFVQTPDGNFILSPEGLKLLFL